LRTKTTRLEINKIQEVTVGRKIRKKKKGEREEEREEGKNEDDEQAQDQSVPPKSPR
jgi:hypothetical protein